MTIELSNIIFTDQDDIVPASGVEEIINTSLANTLAGDDVITGTGGYYGFENGVFENGAILNTNDGNDTITGISTFGGIINQYSSILDTGKGNDLITGTGGQSYGGFQNAGTLNTDDGNDTITGTNNLNYGLVAIYNSILDTGKGNDLITGTGNFDGFQNAGILNTDDGNNTITGTSIGTSGHYGLVNTYGSTFDTGKGDDVIIGISTGAGNSGFLNLGTSNIGDGNDIISGSGEYGFDNQAILNTDDGNDTITGAGTNTGIVTSYGSTLDTGKGNDVITGTSTGTGRNAFINKGTLNTGDGKDSIISQGEFINQRGYLESGGRVFLGDGDDSIIITYPDSIPFFDSFFTNSSIIETGDGNDIITVTGGIYNEGIINSGNGDDFTLFRGFTNGGGVLLGDGNDSIIGDADFPSTIQNFNVIETGEGNDIITSTRIINEGVINTGNGEDSIIADGGFQSVSSGIVFLGEGEDYIKGFGRGDFNGGNGNDILELTSGIYTFGVSTAGGNFAKDGIIMNTVGFEKLVAGSTSYDFASLT
jgi:hypothetical protein